jgi:hypothetical protein
MAATFESFPGRVSKLKRSGRTQGTLWWWRLHKKVTGVTPATMSCGGARWSVAFVSYCGPRDATK